MLFGRNGKTTMQALSHGAAVEVWFCNVPMGKHKLESRISWQKCIKRWSGTYLHTLLHSRATPVTAFKIAGLEHCRISNRNWTEWSTIEGVIARVISKSDVMWKSRGYPTTKSSNQTPVIGHPRDRAPITWQMGARREPITIDNFVKDTISNSNWTEWSTIQGVIARVISKSDEREARLLPELYDTRSNY